MTGKHAQPAGTRHGDEYAAAIVETIRQPLLVLNDDLRVEMANPAFYRHFRVTGEATIGRTIFDLGSGQWDVAVLRELLEDVVPEHTTVEGFEVRHDFPGLGRRVMLVNAREITLAGVAHRRILVAFDDVTERERWERRMQRQAAELRRSNRDLEEFAHAASHDLQEPLRKIVTFADRLAASVDPEALGERPRLYLARMQDAARRMRQRIDDLLQLARVSRAAPAFAPVDLGDVVRAVLEDLEVPTQETGASIEVGALPTVEADRTQMELLVQNLLSNALKFRKPDGAPRVRIRAELESDAPEPTVRMVVEDEGIGFDPEYAERIFRPFQRLHGIAEYEGSGVGLALCRRIVEHHGGTIKATATPGQGSRFTLRLPVRHPPEPEDEEDTV